MSDLYWKKTQDEFRKIFNTINDVRKTSNDIIKYIEELDKMYKNLLNYKTNDKNLLYFGLNTFYFQIRFLQSQFDDSKRQFVFLLNHFYADYYKLFKLIQYHVESGSDQNLKGKIDLETTFPIYDDLSPYTQYKETDIISLHEHILKILEIIDIENEEFAKTNSINDLQNSHQNGIPIANFIHGLSHEQTIMEEYINLYKHYLDFFQNFYTDECMAYNKKLINLFEHIKEHAPLNSNPFIKKICKEINCSNNTYLTSALCEWHYKVNKRKTTPTDSSNKEDPNKEDPNKEDPDKEDPDKEDPNKEDPDKEDPNKEDPNKEDPDKEDPNKEDPDKEDPNKEDPNKEDPNKEDPNKEDPNKEDP